MINKGINNYINEVRSNKENTIQSSQVQRSRFDNHDRMEIGDRNDKLRFHRQREAFIKMNKITKDEETSIKYTKNINPDGTIEETTETEPINTESESIFIHHNETSRNIKNLPLQSEYTINFQTNIFDKIYPVGTIYSCNLKELPFDIGRWELLTNNNTEEETKDIYQWIRIV